MKATNTIAIYSVVACLLISIQAKASDWEEETPSRPAQKEQAKHSHFEPSPESKQGIGPGEPLPLESEAKPEKQHGGPGHMLHGSATEIRTRLPSHPPSYSALTARLAARAAEVQRIDLESMRFLQKAEINKLTPAQTFRNFIEKNHPHFLQSENNKNEALILVKGRWDDSSKPLQALGLKYRAVKTRELAELDLSSVKIMILDCAGEVPKAALQKLRNYVANGGYLLSTDWSLQNVVERSFPGYIEWSRDNSDGVITDAFILTPGSSLLHGVQGRFFTWKLDRLSQCVRVLKPASVEIIARSSSLANTDRQLRVLPDPLLAGALACQFQFGHGKVLHLVGHFENCAASFKPNLLPDPTADAGISLRQVLAANFILEALNKTK